MRPEPHPFLLRTVTLGLLAAIPWLAGCTTKDPAIPTSEDPATESPREAARETTAGTREWKAFPAQRSSELGGTLVEEAKSGVWVVRKGPTEAAGPSGGSGGPGGGGPVRAFGMSVASDGAMPSSAPSPAPAAEPPTSARSLHRFAAAAPERSLSAPMVSTSPAPAGGMLESSEGMPVATSKPETADYAKRGAGGVRSESSRDPAAGPVDSLASKALERESVVESKGLGEEVGGEPRDSESRAEAVQVSPLRAGATDDNAEFEPFVRFLDSWIDRPGVASQADPLDVRERKFVRVVNSAGKPIPAAKVTILDEAADRIALSGSTYGDGRVPWYPLVGISPEGATAFVSANTPGGELVVEASLGGVRKQVRWNGAGSELQVTLDVPQPVPESIRLDVLFLIDTTGSMGDEIGRIKATLLEVNRKLRSLGREFDLRYGAVLYRDLGDAYITMAHPFTADVSAFDEALRSVEANGGGDEAESLNQGLAEAVARGDWREGAAKLIFLIADAPPHMDYPGDVRYGESLKAALSRGIKIHSVAASGLNPLGTFVFRQIAQFTRGKFIFIEYGSTAASAAAHGVEGKTSSNNLDDIIYEQVRDEVAGWGRS